MIGRNQSMTSKSTKNTKKKGKEVTRNIIIINTIEEVQVKKKGDTIRVMVEINTKSKKKD